jgi:hypothetical protein
MKPTVHVLGIHLPGQKIVLTSEPGDALEKIDISSPLKRYFGRPIDTSYDQLTYLDYHSRYSVDTRPASCDVDEDVCEPVRFANPRKNFAICILRSITHGYMNFLPEDCFSNDFLSEAGTTSDFTVVSRIRLSMRLLANLDWYRIETKKLKSASKTPSISIDRQVISVSYWHK